MRTIRIGVVEDDPASCQLVLDYLNRYQKENGEQFTVSVFDDGARIVEKYSPVYDILLLDIDEKGFWHVHEHRIETVGADSYISFIVQ